MEAETARVSSPSSAVAPWFIKISTTSVCPHAAAQETKLWPAGEKSDKRRATPSLSSPQARFWERYSVDAVALVTSSDSTWRLFV